MSTDAKCCKIASLLLQKSTPTERITALNAFHALLIENKADILEANQKDITIQVAEGILSATLLKRLDLSGQKFDDLLQGIIDVTHLTCPTGIKTLSRRIATDLDLYRVSCPIGVLLIIFESRPEVVVQVACLSIFSGNALILKGGKEATHSNRILYKCLHSALNKLASPTITEDCIKMVEAREEIDTLLSLDKYIDMVIPRGSKQLVTHIQNNTRIPVLGHADGLCSIYVAESADVRKTVEIIVDSKTNYPAACNSVETILLNSGVDKSMFKSMCDAFSAMKVTMRVCENSYKILSSFGLNEYVKEATDTDFDTEFLDLTVAIKLVESTNDAIEHINTHGSHHTDCIITKDKNEAELFMESVDSAGVYWNASTRFADGFRYGFGAEIGVSTNKTHARGPVGLEGLVIYKYRLYGDGQCVGQFGEGKKQYMHEDL